MAKTQARTLLGRIPSTEERVVSLLVERGPLYRAELARLLGLSRTRVGSVVAAMLEDELLVEAASLPGVRIDGRAGPALVLSPELGVVGAVQFASLHTDVTVETLTGEVIAERHRDHAAANDDAVRQFRAAAATLDELLAGLGRPRVLGVGVGAFGQIDPKTSVVATVPDEVWWGVNLVELGQACFDAPVVVQNNSRLEALAEASWGAGRGFDPMLYVNLGYGLNAIPVIAGEPVHGAHGGAGELGHVSIDINGPLCSCGGRGCLVLSAAAVAVQDMVRDEFGDDWQATTQAARDGHRRAVHAFLDAADVLGIALASVANVIDPAIIVVGGDLLRAGPRFLERLAVQFHDHALAGSARAQIVPATFGGRGPGGARAAALLARRYAAAHLDHQPSSTQPQ